MQIKSTILIYNCCLIGANERDWWNQFYVEHKERFNIIFVTTNTRADLNFQNIIHTGFDQLLYDADLDSLDEKTAIVNSDIAQCDTIWECYDHNKSRQKAYAWYGFWLTAMNAYNPSAVYIWSGYTMPGAALAKLADVLGIEKYYLERGPFAKTFVCDKKGVNYNSSFIKNYDQISVTINNDSISQFINFYFKTGTSNWDQPPSTSRKDFFERYHLPEDKLIIFFPSQVDSDANIKVFSNYNSVFEACEKVIDSIRKCHDKVYLVVKKHPYQKDDIEKFRELLSDTGQIIDDAHIFDCIKYSDAIISINSSVAAEAALLGKPILLLGNSILSTNKETLKLNDFGELDDKINELICRTSAEFTARADYLYLNKLLLGYLFSADPFSNKLGVKSVAEIPLPVNSRMKDKKLSDRDVIAITSYIKESFNNFLRLKATEERLKATEESVIAILNTKSWKITKPLRTLFRKYLEIKGKM